MELEAVRRKDFIAEKGFDPDLVHGSLRRAIQRYIENPLSEEMLKGRFRRD